MIPKEFDYVAPNTVQEALQALRDGGEDAKVLAGGHSLIPAMKLRLAAPSRLVDLRKIGELRGANGANGNTEIGAMTTYLDLQSSGSMQLLAECAASIGDMQVRARGTVGGSVAHADPAADMPAAILALDSVLVAAKLDGNGGSGLSTREIPARDFFLELYTTALQPDEILTHIRVPAMQGRTGSAYVKVRNKASHYALVGVAVVLTLAGDGTCSNVSVGVTGAAATPFRAEAAENALRGTKLEENDIQNAVGTLAGQDVEWMSDLFGSQEYRKHLAGVVTSRAIEMARSRA